MSYSLLWPQGGAPTEKPDQTILADLALDRALAVILPDVAERTTLAPLLAAPPTDRETVLARQAVMRDLLASPEALAGWQKLFGRMAELKRAADDERRRSIAAQARGREENALAEARARLQMAAMTLKRLLLLIGEMDTRLAAIPCTAQPLRALLDRIGEIAHSAATAELIARCGPLIDLGERSEYRFALTLDDEGRPASALYLDRAPAAESAEAETPVRRRLFAPRKLAPPPTPGVPLDPTSPSLRRRLAAAGLTATAATLEQIAAALLAELAPVARELPFFAAGARFAAYFAARGLPTCLPDFSASGSLDAAGLYDPDLAVTLPEGSPIVKNPLTLPADCPGVIVTGANNAGKTVFLRAVGQALLLGQAGFPICAERASLPTVTRVASCFAAAERSEQIGDEAGRFETEVRRLAAAVERAAPGELLLLNEPFQTTAYAEGAEALADVLGYLAARGTRWLTVTHLDLPLPPDSGHLALRCGEDHRVG